MKHIYSSILLLLIVATVIPNSSFGQISENIYFKQYFGHAYTSNHGQFVKLKVKDARGVIDSVTIRLDSNATFDIDSQLGEVDIQNTPQKDLDLRIFRKSIKNAYFPLNDTNGLPLMIRMLSQWERSGLGVVSSSTNYESKNEIIPTNNVRMNYGLLLPSTNFALQLHAEYFPVELYVSSSKFGDNAFDFEIINKSDSNKLLNVDMLIDNKAISFPNKYNEKAINPTLYSLYLFSDSSINNRIISITEFTQEFYTGINLNEMENQLTSLKSFLIDDKTKYISIKSNEILNNTNNQIDFSIYNLSGDLIFNQKFENSLEDYQLNVENLQSGIYFLRSKNMLNISKIIKK